MTSQSPIDARLALEPFAKLGGANDGVMPAFHDLADDVVIYSNSGAVITAGDVRTARQALGWLHAPWPKQPNFTDAEHEVALHTPSSAVLPASSGEVRDGTLDGLMLDLFSILGDIEPQTYKVRLRRLFADRLAALKSSPPVAVQPEEEA